MPRVIVVKTEKKYDEYYDWMSRIFVDTTNWQPVSEIEHKALEAFVLENPEYKLVTDETERISDMIQQGFKISELQRQKEERAAKAKATRQSKALKAQIGSMLSVLQALPSQSV